MPSSLPPVIRLPGFQADPVRRALSLLLASLLGCACAPASAQPADPAEAGAHDVPDAEPAIEPLLGGNGAPYRIFGRTYAPRTDDEAYLQRGHASWYGRRFHGRRTASGERYDMNAMTAAHPTLPLPSYVKVRNLVNGREVIVRVNDRGPFHPGRIIDLSYVAARKLGVLRGVVPVEVERITHEAIRTGAWRRDDTPAADPEEIRQARASRLDDLPPGPAALLPVPAGMAAERGDPLASAE